MKDAKGHGSDARGAGGQFQTSTGVTRTVIERQAMRAMVDKRRFGLDKAGDHVAGRTSIRNLPATPSLATRMAALQAGDPAHGRGIVNATAGKKLA
jgi:hypothetical protein